MRMFIRAIILWIVGVIVISIPLVLFLLLLPLWLGVEAESDAYGWYFIGLIFGVIFYRIENWLMSKFTERWGV